MLMSSLKFFLGLCFVFSFCLVGSAQSAQMAEMFTVSPLVGFHVFEGDQNTEDDLSFGLAVGYNVTERWGVEFDARHTATEVDLAAIDNSSLKIWTMSLNALYHFNPEGRFTPYLLGGFGGMMFDSEDFDADGDFMLNWGVGAKYFLGKSFALRLDVRHILDLHSDRVFDQGSQSDTDHNLIASAGLCWQFSDALPALEPLDRDGKSIIDQNRQSSPSSVSSPVAVATPAAPAVADRADEGGGEGAHVRCAKCPETAPQITADQKDSVVKFNLHIEFDFDKADIRPEYAGKLRDLASFIAAYPDAMFILSGHTDSIGTEHYNMGLSLRRAQAVRDYLVDTFKADPAILKLKGYGETAPVADNATKEGRQRNRRVVIINVHD
ncbi:MAG: hypothetical protein C0614_03445 [Desulfuromonas sp.]|nr:MAG: hypothetical protein C0614_03445 [Desulfuromonas sp.]